MRIYISPSMSVNIPYKDVELSLMTGRVFNKGSTCVQSHCATRQ